MALPFAPHFLFDSLSQHPLSNFGGYWDKLSDYLTDLGGVYLTKGETPEQFTECSCLVGKWVFCHCPLIFDPWSPYIAKYP